MIFLLLKIVPKSLSIKHIIFFNNYYYVNLNPAKSGDFNTNGSISTEEWKKFEEERQSFFCQMDDKDEEINQLSQEIEKLREHILEQDEVKFDILFKN